MNGCYRKTRIRPKVLVILNSASAEQHDTGTAPDDSHCTRQRTGRICAGIYTLANFGAPKLTSGCPETNVVRYSVPQPVWWMGALGGGVAPDVDMSVGRVESTEKI
jgi:hypothetical protein